MGSRTRARAGRPLTGENRLAPKRWAPAAAASLAGFEDAAPPRDKSRGFPRKNLMNSRVERPHAPRTTMRLSMTIRQIGIFALTESRSRASGWEDYPHLDWRFISST